MAKATHNGTCQACGRVQAVKANGKLAKHGYTVDWGYFNGTCPGSDKAPLENDRTYNDEVVEGLIAHGKKLAAATVENTEKVPVKEEAGREFGRRVYNTHWIGSQEELDALREAAGRKVQAYSFDRELDWYVRTLHRESEQALNAAANLIDLRDARHGQELYKRETREETAARKAADKKAAGPTKAEVKRACENLNREYEALRNERRDYYLNNRNADGDVLEGYWEMPYHLHQYREAKHAGYFADLAPKVAELVAAREEVRAQLPK